MEVNLKSVFTSRLVAGITIIVSGLGMIPYFHHLSALF